MIEKILRSILGGVFGAAVGVILMKLNIPGLSEDLCSSVIILMVTLGVFVSIAIAETNEAETLIRNNKLRDETVALITHEMRTGLTSTSWAIERVIKNYGNVMSKEDNDLLGEIIKSIKGIVLHSVNLLDVSMLDIGKLKISLEEVPLEKLEILYTEIVDKYTLGAEKHGINFITHIKLDHDKKVEVDMLRLRIIIENLLENAIQYTTLAKKEIELNIQNVENELQIKVRDSGIGIPESEKANIFGEFFRATNARKELSAGSGIGLYTTQQYVKAHRGSIRFESIEAQGTTFFVTIPLKTVADVNGFVASINKI
jgi:signal transduction histidine kinase